MKRVIDPPAPFLLILLAFLFHAAVASAIPPAPWEADELIGREAPAFTLTDLSGKKVTLGEMRGKVVIVNFWATWCPPCRTEMPSMNRLLGTLGKEGLAMVAISSDSSADVVRSFLSRNQADFLVLHDPTNQVGERFKVYSLPTSYVLGRDGVILKRIFGAYDWDTAESIGMFKSILAR